MLIKQLASIQKHIWKTMEHKAIHKAIKELTTQKTGRMGRSQIEGLSSLSRPVKSRQKGRMRSKQSGGLAIYESSEENFSTPTVGDQRLEAKVKLRKFKPLKFRSKL